MEVAERAATKAGVGFSDAVDSRAAGVEAARSALEGLRGDPCSLAVFVATGAHDADHYYEGVRTVVGDAATVVGCSGAGVITNDHLGYNGYYAGVAALASEDLRSEVFVEPGLDRGEGDVGEALGRRVRAVGLPVGSSLLLMYSMVRRTELEGGLLLNMATPLVDGMVSALGGWPAVAGMGVLGDIDFLQPSYVYHDGRLERQGALALTLAGGLRMDTHVLHGCRPTSPYRTVTRSEGNVVYELDGRPALDVVSEMFGPAPGVRWEDFPIYITLGINRGEKFGEVREEDYANRDCMAFDQERRALVMFEPIEVGEEVQLMRRSLDPAYIGVGVRKLMEKVAGRRPVLALYIDCAGRTAAYSGLDWEEAEEVQRHLGDLPLLGFYTGLELGMVRGDLERLGWTGVLCVLSEASPTP